MHFALNIYARDIGIYLTVEQEGKGKKVKPNHFLYKPFKFQQLINIFEKVKADKSNKNKNYNLR
jgi:hypothetical protein